MTGILPTDSPTSIYHVSLASNLSEIAEQGIVPSDTSHRNELESKLSQLAEKHDVDFPVKRQDCVYFYPSWKGVTQILGHDSEYSAISLETLSHKGVVHVDLSEIESKTYIGDFKLISDAIDHQYMNEPDEVMVTSSLTDSLLRYAKSFIEISCMSEFNTISDEFHTPEVVVEAGVDPSAIIEFVFLKQVHTEGVVTSVRPFEELPSLCNTHSE